MEQKILSEIDIPLLDHAIAQRGYALVLGKPPAAPGRDVAAVLRAWGPGIRIRSTRVPEIALLLYLAERRGEFVSRRELLEQVWGLRFDPGTNVVAVHISKLRAKIDRDFVSPMIRSAKGLGYRLDAV